MNIDEYQIWAVGKKSNDLTEREAQLTWALGLVDECIEMNDAESSSSGGPHGLLDELGDKMWYVVTLADAYQINHLLRFSSGQGTLESKKKTMLLLSKSVGELVKKHVSHGHKMNRSLLSRTLNEIIGTIGDVADSCQSSLAEVMQMNQEKLNQRYAGRFTSEESIKREEITGQVYTTYVGGKVTKE